MNKLDRIKAMLWILALSGLVAIVYRFYAGLGAATGLSDAMPWGIWKIINMVAGVALATGGFMLAAIVYIFNLEKYRPVLKPAILVAFLGYGSSVFALFLDIGLPYRIWHPLIFWNDHSFLFEVAMCVMFYFTITIIELAPIILEKYNFTKIISILHKATIPIVITGITLSSMHHTSLGSLFLVMPFRLHPLWYTMLLPVHFFLSAIGAGIMSIILICIIYSKLYDQKISLSILTGLAKISAAILAIAFIVKLSDLAYHNKLSYIFNGAWESYLFQLEMFLAMIIPVIIVLIPKARNSIKGLTIASLSGILGLVLNRTNVGIFGILRTSTESYIPTLTEIALSLGVIAAAALVFLFITENFSVFSKPKLEVTTEEFRNSNWFERWSSIWSGITMTSHVRISFLIAIVVPILAGIFYSTTLNGYSQKSISVKAPLAVDQTRKILTINGNQNANFVVFKHDAHKERLGGAKSCDKCHHLNFPNDKATRCSACHRDMYQPTMIFDHTYHQNKLLGNKSCEKCHDMSLPKSISNSKACYKCHEKNMKMLPPKPGKTNLYALSYEDAMHSQCINCHKQKAKELNKPAMAECAQCHKEAWSEEFKNHKTVHYNRYKL